MRENKEKDGSRWSGEWPSVSQLSSVWLAWRAASIAIFVVWGMISIAVLGRLVDRSVSFPNGTIEVTRPLVTGIGGYLGGLAFRRQLGGDVRWLRRFVGYPPYSRLDRAFLVLLVLLSPAGFVGEVVRVLLGREPWALTTALTWNHVMQFGALRGWRTTDWIEEFASEGQTKASRP